MNDQTDPSCCQVQNERDILKIEEDPNMKISRQIVKYKLTESEVFDANGKIDTEKLRHHFNHEGRLNLATAKRIIKNATEILRKEDSLLKVEGFYSYFSSNLTKNNIYMPLSSCINLWRYPWSMV